MCSSDLSSDAAVKARLHTGAGGTYVWVVNPTRMARNVKISLPSPFQRAVELWQESSRPTISGNTLAVNVEDRNVAVIRLEYLGAKGAPCGRPLRVESRGSPNRTARTAALRVNIGIFTVAFLSPRSHTSRGLGVVRSSGESHCTRSPHIGSNRRP